MQILYTTTKAQTCTHLTLCQISKTQQCWICMIRKWNYKTSGISLNIFEWEVCDGALQCVALEFKICFFFTMQLDISPLMYDKVTLEKRLQDTQLKLKRKLNDGEEQDRQILRLQTELNDLHSLCEILKDHVNNKEKLESIMEEHEKKRELRDAENLTQKNTEDSSEEIIRRQEPKSQHKESKVCIIQWQY